MKFLINNTICFDYAQGVLSLVNDQKVSVQLSRPGTRLFHELITHSGITLSRDVLLQNVWENHGLIPSNNNLNNHISFLRKVLSQLGLEENIIITSPKEGFRLQAEVETVSDEHPLDDVSSEGNTEEKTEGKTVEAEMNDESISGKETFGIKKLQKHIIHFIKVEIFNWASISLIIVLIFSIVVINSSFIKKSLYKEKNDVDSIGLCKIIDLSSQRNGIEKWKIATIKSTINRKNINCVNQKSTIYIKTTDFTVEEKNNQQAVFVAQCFQNNDKNGAKCENYLLITIKKP